MRATVLCLAAVLLEAAMFPPAFAQTSTPYPVRVWTRKSFTVTMLMLAKVAAMGPCPTSLHM
jgi:hypothetical protein